MVKKLLMQIRHLPPALKMFLGYSGVIVVWFVYIAYNLGLALPHTGQSTTGKKNDHTIITKQTTDKKESNQIGYPIAYAATSKKTNTQTYSPTPVSIKKDISQTVTPTPNSNIPHFSPTPIPANNVNNTLKNPQSAGSSANESQHTQPTSLPTSTPSIVSQSQTKNTNCLTVAGNTVCSIPTQIPNIHL